MREADFLLEDSNKRYQDEVLESEYCNLYNDDPEDDKIERIRNELATVDRRLEQKNQQIEDLLNEYYLLRKQSFTTYSCVLSTYDHMFINASRMIEGAREWLKKCASGEKIDKRKKYPEKDSYDLALSKFKEYLGTDEIVSIDEILDHGFSCDGYHIKFSMATGATYALYVPTKPTMDSFVQEGARVFKYSVIYYENTHYGMYIATSFFIKDIAKDFNKHYQALKMPSDCK